MTEKQNVPKGGFNKIWLDKLTGSHEYSDTTVKGLRLRVSESGQKKFSLLYTFKCKKRRMPLGEYPHITIAQARADANDAKSLIRQGIEPQANRDSSKVAKDEPTVEDLLNIYLEECAKIDLKEKSWKEIERAFSRLPNKIKDTYISQLDEKSLRNNIRTHLKDIGIRQGYKRSANLTFQFLRRGFGWLMEQEHIEDSPMINIVKPFKKAEKPKDRFLLDDELKNVYQYVDGLGYPLKQFVLLLILTGQRRGEVANMEFSDIDFKEKTWTIYRDNTKAQRKHIVPLSQQVIRILKNCPSGGKYVLSTTGGDRPVSGFSKWQGSVIKGSGVEDWTFHDLRRTLTTNLSRMKVSPIIKAAVLNHSVRDAQGVTGTYDVYDYFIEKQDALQEYADFVDELVGKKPKLEIVE